MSDVRGPPTMPTLLVLSSADAAQFTCYHLLAELFQLRPF